jgi:phosphatidylglycerol---prolipoprotein diacylglyceryl transferase
MLPILVDFGPLQIATHDAFSLAGILVGFLIYYRALRRRRMLDRTIVIISILALFGAGIGARLITCWEHLPYYKLLGEAPLTYVIEHSGKSLIGAIAGGYLTILVAKRLFGYTRSTGDCYALAIPIATAIGRIGCFLSELPLGSPTDLPWGISVPPSAAAMFPYCPGCDRPMHPSMLYEIAFNLIAALLIVRFGSRITVQGDLLKAYLLAAGIFRFLVEFVRANPPQALGLSGPQWVLIPLVALLVWHFVRQVRRGVYSIPEPPPRDAAWYGAPRVVGVERVAGPALASPRGRSANRLPQTSARLPAGRVSNPSLVSEGLDR